MKEIVSPLLAWYKQNKRSMPWRDAPTPYHVWVSEIMLQQTRIEAALPYYLAFTAELPDIKALAEADDDRLMKLWQGLGYYSRVRNLKKTAQTVVGLYGGELPRKAELLKKLPGIGDYTAGAIASIAYGEPEPAVDGNVLRVVMRLQACNDDVLDSKTRKRVAEELKSVYPSGSDAGALTQGLMELGETICIPGEARCDACPLRSVCKAYNAGKPSDYPVRLVKTEKRTEKLTVFVLKCGNLYAVQKRENKGLLAGLWQLPNEKGHLTADEAANLFDGVLSVQPCGEAKHVFTHIIWQMTGYIVDVKQPLDGYIWKTASEIKNGCAVPTAFKFYAKYTEI